VSAPPRLLERQATLPDELRRALHAAPGAPRPDQLRDLAANLGGALGISLAAPLAPTALSAKAASVTAGKGFWAIATWLLGGAAVGVGMSVAASYGSERLQPPPVVASPSARRVIGSGSRIAQVVPTVNAAPNSSSVAPAPARSRAATSTQQLADAGALESPAMAEPRTTELSLLERAQQAVTRDPSAALLLCEQHAAAFPNGSFTQEREVIAIDALLRLGRIAQAQARADGFLSHYSDSAHAQRVRALLAKDRP